MSSDCWEYYNHSAVCKYAPHREADTDAIKNNTIWNLDGKKPLLVCYTTDFDCKEETQWWYTILDHPFDISAIKAKHRYQINRGIKNFSVKQIDFESCADKMNYILNYVREKCYGFNAVELKKSGKNAVYLGAFEAENPENLIGYAILHEHREYVHFTSLKVLPEYERDCANAALVYAITQRYADKLSKDFYISNGTRTVNHETKFNDYLIRIFEFRKAYCKLNIIYRKGFGAAVKVLSPFLPLIERLSHKISPLRPVSGILKMDKYSR